MEAKGESGLVHGMSKSDYQELKKLKKENHDLKILLAEKELEAKLKDELLKKSIPT